jgi:hypothetical protein
MIVFNLFGFNFTKIVSVALRPATEFVAGTFNTPEQAPGLFIKIFLFPILGSSRFCVGKG